MKDNKFKSFLGELAADFRWSQFFSMFLLMILSTLFIYTATSKTGGGLPDEVKKQWVWFGVGFVIYIVVALMDYHWFCRKSWFFYLGVMISLLAVKYSPLGKSKYGARRWLEFQGLSVQPSEFAKISVLLALCYYLSRAEGALSDWRRMLFAFLLAMVPGYYIEKQPDLGTALVVVAILFILLFLSGAPMKLFGWLGVIAAIIISVVGIDTYRYVKYRQEIADGSISENAKFKSYLHLDRYKFDRILVWIAPQKVDRLGEGWNREQALIAIGSGGLQGKGWMNGNVTRGGYLPRTVSLNDFIFAVFAEEAGFMGGVTLISLYGIILWGGVRIALRARDRLGMLLASGASFLLFFHIFMNMGMTLGILPIVGVPLPLMSYGGSFVLVSMIALGLLQSVWLHRKPY